MVVFRSYHDICSVISMGFYDEQWAVLSLCFQNRRAQYNDETCSYVQLHCATEDLTCGRKVDLFELLLYSSLHAYSARCVLHCTLCFTVSINTVLIQQIKIRFSFFKSVFLASFVCSCLKYCKTNHVTNTFLLQFI